jgi:large-conductance mechanosensitive channel
MSKLIAEFKEFLEVYKVTGLAVAFIMGVAATALVKSLVDNIIMPLIIVLGIYTIGMLHQMVGGYVLLDTMCQQKQNFKHWDRILVAIVLLGVR